jgi:hemoglobin-like flavoprotein
MADNDRIKIIKETMPSVESNGVTIILHNKMIREYEDMIAESIYNHTIYKNSYSGLNPNELEKIEEESKDLAKAVVDRLLGEGE